VRLAGKFKIKIKKEIKIRKQTRKKAPPYRLLDSTAAAWLNCSAGQPPHEEKKMETFEVSFTGTIIVQADSKDKALDEVADTLNDVLFAWNIEEVV
jgi:hypothetical protein